MLDAVSIAHDVAQDKAAFILQRLTRHQATLQRHRLLQHPHQTTCKLQQMNSFQLLLKVSLVGKLTVVAVQLSQQMESVQ